MTFTDDDLKRLKKLMEDSKVSNIPLFQDNDNVKALLARLEAAENVCDTIEACLDIYTQQAVKDSLKSWRKTAGK